MIYIIGEENRKRNNQLIMKARELANGMNDCEIKLLFLSDKIIDAYKKYEVDEIILLKNSAYQMYYDNEKLVQTMIGLINEDDVDLILFPSNAQCRELAALLGARLDRALMTDCTNIWMQENEYMGMKPSLDGTHFSIYRFEGEKPYLAVVKNVESKVSAPGKKIEDIRVIEAKGSGSEDVHLICVERKEDAKKDIKDAEIIFAGGRGMLNEDSFLALRKLASLYHASIGGSRPVVDSGWASVDEQVGQTGSFVHPKVYLAFGISGAVQHIAGMKESQYIIAVNNQKDSPIFRYCDYGIYSDANSIVRNMINLLCQTGDK